LISSGEHPRKDVSVGSATYVRVVAPSLCVANFRSSIVLCWLSLRAPLIDTGRMTLPLSMKAGACRLCPLD